MGSSESAIVRLLAGHSATTKEGHCNKTPRMSRTDDPAPEWGTETGIGTGTVGDEPALQEQALQKHSTGQAARAAVAGAADESIAAIGRTNDHASIRMNNHREEYRNHHHLAI